jgi:hypothetical protein
MKNDNPGIMPLRQIDGIAIGIGGIFAQICGIQDLFNLGDHHPSPLKSTLKSFH